MNFEHSPRTLEYLARLKAFMEHHLAPIETSVLAHNNAHGGDWKKWTVDARFDAIRAKAKAEGLWNLFLPEHDYGPGLTNVEYAPLAEQMGRSLIASEFFNCSAPDTGNMEVLVKYGSPAQKKQWLEPLLAGDIRSIYAMTEPETASSDATNLQLTITADGDDVIINGSKWWLTNLGHPRAKILIVMGRTDDASRDRKFQHSQVLVPLDTPGLEIKRMLSVMGYHDAPSGHGELVFKNVRVPKQNVIGELGMGFEISQGRLGPGRIHHCMRAIGAAEVGLEYMIKRSLERKAFGKQLVDLGGNKEKIAEARMAIDQARLLTLHAAWRLDEVGALAAMKEISAIKVAVPRMLLSVLDEAMQMHGAGGLSADFPLAEHWGHARTLRLVDGPDAVHLGVIARQELKGLRSSAPAQK